MKKNKRKIEKQDKIIYLLEQILYEIRSQRASNIPIQYFESRSRCPRCGCTIFSGQTHVC